MRRIQGNFWLQEQRRKSFGARVRCKKHFGIKDDAGFFLATGSMQNMFWQLDRLASGTMNEIFRRQGRCTKLFSVRDDAGNLLVPWMIQEVFLCQGRCRKFAGPSYDAWILLAPWMMREIYWRQGRCKTSFGMWRFRVRDNDWDVLGSGEIQERFWQGYLSKPEIIMGIFWRKGQCTKSLGVRDNAGNFWRQGTTQEVFSVREEAGNLFATRFISKSSAKTSFGNITGPY